MEYNHNTGTLLQRQGFVDIGEEVIRIPFNPWPKDRELKTIGSWFNLGLTDGLSALSMAPFTRMFNWSSQNVDDFVKDVRTEVCNRQIHAYCHL